MEVIYNNESPLILICEFINKHKSINILHELIDKPENITISFSDKNAVSLNTIYYNANDVTHVLCIDDDTPTLKDQQKVEAVQFLCNRYINLIKKFIFNELENSGKFLDQTFKSYSSMLIGRFREQILESAAENSNDLYEPLTIGDQNITKEKIKLFKMENVMGKQDNSSEEKDLLHLICKPYFKEKNHTDIEDDEGVKGNKNSDTLKSLTIPKMSAIQSLEDYKWDDQITVDNDINYIDASGLNNYLESLLDTHLKHHIDKLGRKGKIPKRKIYSKYGVTPYLIGSSNKSSEQVRQYDEDIKQIEDELNISQVIVISFLMNLRYMSSENSSNTKTSPAARIHQIITSPSSNITVPPDFIKTLQELIHTYAKETSLSDDPTGNKDSSSIKLIESFLLSRFGLSTLNEHNNLLMFIDDLQYYVKEFMTHGSDYITLLNIDALTYKLTSAYNEWLQSICINDKSIDYGKLYYADIKQLHILLNIPNHKLKPLQDTFLNVSYIKERFDAIH